MLLEIGKNYKLVFKINNTELIYKAKVIELDNTFVTFIDRYGEKFTYNLSTLLQVQEAQ